VIIYASDMDDSNMDGGMTSGATVTWTDGSNWHTPHAWEQHEVEGIDEWSNVTTAIHGDWGGGGGTRSVTATARDYVNDAGSDSDNENKIQDIEYDENGL